MTDETERSGVEEALEVRGEIGGETSELVKAALTHCDECFAFREEGETLDEVLDRALTRVRHYREEYGEREAESGGWASRYQQDVCALLQRLNRLERKRDHWKALATKDAESLLKCRFQREAFRRQRDRLREKIDAVREVVDE